MSGGEPVTPAKRKIAGKFRKHDLCLLLKQGGLKFDSLPNSMHSHCCILTTVHCDTTHAMY